MSSLNEEVLGIDQFSHWNNAKDLQDSEYFWAFTVVFGYQPQTEILFRNTNDGDPNGEGLLIGGTPEYSFFGDDRNGTGTVFMESVREDFLETQAPSVITEVTDTAVLVTGYNNTLYGTIAHEIGHSPEEQGAAGDHDELGLQDTNNILQDYTTQTIKRFRQADSWTE